MHALTTAALQEGEVFAGKYVVEGTLGSGGMGVVLAARHLTLDAPRAIKLPHSVDLHDCSVAERLLDEARILARLGSEHVVRVFDSGQLDNGVPYIVLEHLEGCDLGEILEREKRISIGDAARYLMQVCDAMAEAHALGIVHLDLKPSNLFLTSRSDGSPCVKVIDFGVAQILAPGCPYAGKMLSGTPSYMAPEQLIASPDVGPQTDIWALGVILLELTTGKLPFDADTLTATLLRVMNAEPALPYELPKGAAAIIRRCLEKSSLRRFQSVVELRAALSGLASDSEVARDAELDEPQSGRFVRDAPRDTERCESNPRRWAAATRDLGAAQKDGCASASATPSTTPKTSRRQPCAVTAPVARELRALPHFGERRRRRRRDDGGALLVQGSIDGTSARHDRGHVTASPPASPSPRQSPSSRTSAATAGSRAGRAAPRRPTRRRTRPAAVCSPRSRRGQGC